MQTTVRLSGTCRAHLHRTHIRPRRFGATGHHAGSRHQVICDRHWNRIHRLRVHVPASWDLLVHHSETLSLHLVETRQTTRGWQPTDSCPQVHMPLGFFFFFIFERYWTIQVSPTEFLGWSAYHSTWCVKFKALVWLSQFPSEEFRCLNWLSVILVQVLWWCRLLVVKNESKWQRSHL